MLSIKFIIAAMVLAFMSSCAGDPEIVEKTVPIVVKPPESAYDCPDDFVFNANDPEITQADVAEALLKFQEYYNRCARSIEEVKSFLDEAESTIESEDNE